MDIRITDDCQSCTALLPDEGSQILPTSIAFSQLLKDFHELASFRSTLVHRIYTQIRSVKKISFVAKYGGHLSEGDKRQEHLDMPHFNSK